MTQQHHTLQTTQTFRTLSARTNITTSTAKMLHDWEDLACIQDLAHKEYNRLKLWLRSQTQDPDSTFSTISHPVHMLRSILGAAIREIRDNLDQQIGILVEEAQSFYIRIYINDYYITRSDDWDGMLPTDIDEMSAKECVGLMHAARDEIAWLVNEIGRLECYIRVEREMVKWGLTQRRPYMRPLERKTKSQDTEVEQEDEGILKSVDSAVESRSRAASMELD